MKIITAKTKESSDWTQNIVKSSIQKEASLGVNSGKVFCPKTGKTTSTIHCELCQHCAGIDFKLASATENIKCTHAYDTGDKGATIDSAEKFQSTSVKKQEPINTEDLKSVFARSELEDNFTEKEKMSEHQIVSAKNISEDEFEGSGHFVSKYNNSVFNPEVLAELEASAKKEDLEKEAEVKETARAESDRRSEWMADREKELDDIDYMPQPLITKSIAHESKASNPDVGEYKFSVFDNIQKRLDGIPDRTQGELLKEQKEDRKKSISREAKKDDWESEDKSSKTSNIIVGEFFDSLFEE